MGTKKVGRGVKVSLKQLPDDVYQILKRHKEKQEDECRCSYSYERVIYLLIRRYNDPNYDKKTVAA